MFGKIFGNKKGDSNVRSGAISVSRAEEIFEYGRLKNLVGSVANGWVVSWAAEPFQLAGNSGKTNPAHIAWHADPRHAFAAIVDGAIEYHYGEDSGFARVDLCPLATSKNEIALVDELFAALYEKCGLPASLEQLRAARASAKPKAGSGESKKSGPDLPKDKKDLLKAYLRGENDDLCFDMLSERPDALMWVDWREEDTAIVQYCEDILRTGALSAEDNDSDDDIGFEIIICYKGARQKIPYAGNGADRDTTIITLNEVLQPDYEIRFCKASDGSDTLAFLPLAAGQWRELEAEFGREAVDSRFLKITAGAKFFG